jgi:N-methylhydantoinase B/oxoprolinase/acetone carboxylase alpha subunit
MAPQIDPVTLEVIRNALPAIANEMAADVTRTSSRPTAHSSRRTSAAFRTSLPTLAPSSRMR